MELRYKGESLGVIQGENGKDGFSPIVTVSKVEGGHRVNIRDASSDKTFDIMDGVNGTSGLPTIKDAAIVNISYFDGIELPCCVHLVNCALGYSFVNDIVYVAKSVNELTVVTMDNAHALFKIESDGTLTLMKSERLEPRLEDMESAIDELTKTGGKPGEDGLSAYEIAVKNGFVGTVQEWLASLVGPKGSKGDPGQPFTIAKTYASIIGMDGDYDNTDVPVGSFVMIDTDDVEDPDNAKLYLKTESGFSYIADLSGATGIRGLTGKSAYDVAVDEGFVGTKEEWLASLVGSMGQDGANGEDGKSAYAIAVENGFTGTEQEWLESLVGQNGTSPIVDVEEIEGGHRVTITDVNGTNTFDVMNGLDGEEGNATTLPVKAPIGCIVWWSGTTANIPTGWHLCDGTEGTIDLRDKFVLSAGTNHGVGDTGGSEEVTLTIAQMPSHSHGLSHGSSSGSASSGVAWANYRSFDLSSATGSNGSSKPHSNMPPYYTLCAIQKITADETDAVNIEFDDTMTTNEDGLIGVASPIQSILTQEEFDALNEDEQNKGFYVIKDRSSNNMAYGLTINGQLVAFPMRSTNGSSDAGPITITLFADNWDENNEQTIDVPEIISDETAQLITPTPSSASFNNYYTSDIMLIAQGEGSLTFKALADPPSVNCNVNLYIQCSGYSIEEYDTDDGWHVRKYSDGYAEMIGSFTYTVSKDTWVETNNVFVYPQTVVPTYPYPIQLTKLYVELINVYDPANAYLVTGPAARPSNTRTGNYVFFRASNPQRDLNVKMTFFITGRWK